MPASSARAGAGPSGSMSSAWPAGPRPRCWRRSCRRPSPAYPGPNPCAGPMTGRAGSGRCATSPPSSTARWCPSSSSSARPLIRVASHRATRPSAIASWDRRASSLRISRATRPASSRARSCSIRRSGAIRSASRRRASARALTLSLRPDEALLDEVVGLVEWPVVLLGRIDAAFMDLPPEVLTTVMRAHQKYFALRGFPWPAGAALHHRLQHGDPRPRHHHRRRQ